MKNFQSILLGVSVLLFISLVNNAQARSVHLESEELSEVIIKLIRCFIYLTVNLNPFLKNYKDHMFDNNARKHVMFLEPISPAPGMQSIGQIGGIDTDADGKLIVFHRGSRRWGPE
jgi:hypothetical protein